MAVKFIYSGEMLDPTKEVVIQRVCDIASIIISLPDTIEIEFKKLENVYGELLMNPRFKNRIRLDERLSTREVIIPLVHELIHLNQVHTGRLRHARNGVYWNNKLYMVDLTNTDIDSWRTYPWEIDVAEKEKKLLQEILRLPENNG